MDLQQELQAALSHHQAGCFAEAEALYRKVLVENPLQPDALHLLGMLAFEVKQHPAAVKLIQHAISLRPAPEFYSNLGLVLAAQQQYDRAELAYNEALRLKSDYLEALLGLGAAIYHLRKYEPAAEVYRRLLELDPTSAAAHNNLGNALKFLGKVDEAAECYRQALKLNPNDAEIMVNLGELLHYSGQSDLAIEILRQATLLAPDLEQAFSQLGRVLRARNDRDGARDAFRSALRIGMAKSVIYRSLVPFLGDR